MDDYETVYVSISAALFTKSGKVPVNCQEHIELWISIERGLDDLYNECIIKAQRALCVCYFRRRNYGHW